MQLKNKKSIIKFLEYKSILVEFGLGKAGGLVKFSSFYYSFAKVDVTNKQKKKTNKQVRVRTGVAQHF